MIKGDINGEQVGRFSRVAFCAVFAVALMFALLYTGCKKNVTGPPPPPPVADFSAQPTSGTAPIRVYFTDRSKGEITSWSWDFGDGGTSTSRFPSHVYSSHGSYTVFLIVTGPTGTDTEIKWYYITVF